MKFGEFTTIKEYATDPVEGRTYTWNKADVSGQTCVQEVAFTDTGYYRTTVYEGITENCSSETVRT